MNMLRFFGLMAASSLMTLVAAAGCGNTVDCPDSYGACVAYAEETNARHEACNSEVRLDVDEVCDESLADPQVCLDCVEYYACFTERTQCVDGSIELETVDCPPCGSAG
jgi:hypothetical protein